MTVHQIALAQINPTIGAVHDNIEQIHTRYKQAQDQNADLVVFPELALSGYPPLDLLLKSDFVSHCEQSLKALADEIREPGILVGFPRSSNHDDGILYNSAALLHDGEIRQVTDKCLLPTYDVFLERRYFQPGDHPRIMNYRNTKIGVTICEDIWKSEHLPDQVHYRRDPLQKLENQSVDLMVNLSASPFWLEKEDTRTSIFRSVVDRLDVPIVCCNMVGGNDEIIFDGRSTGFSRDKKRLDLARRFQEDQLVVSIQNASNQSAPTDSPPQNANQKPPTHQNLRRTNKQDPSAPNDQDSDQPDNQKTDRNTLHEQNPDRKTSHEQNPDRKGGDNTKSLKTSPEEGSPRQTSQVIAQGTPEEEALDALTLGLQDYVRKCGFKRVVLGLSGGIDSSLTAAIAREALGPDQVLGIFMPSHISSEESRQDAEELAQNLGISYRSIPINTIYQPFLNHLKEQLNTPPQKRSTDHPTTKKSRDCEGATNHTNPDRNNQQNPDQPPHPEQSPDREGGDTPESLHSSREGNCSTSPQNQYQNIEESDSWQLMKENLQARIRGNLLMAVSNQSGRLLLNTGNKSELAVGYCTLYGDMAGGLSVLGDTSKTMVYRISQIINYRTDYPCIPQNILEKAPSAELREDQIDQDTLPPYSTLDNILERYIEMDQGMNEIINAGMKKEQVQDVFSRVNRNEFKRHQAPPTLKITRRAFGIGRHMPIACKYDHTNG